MKKFLLNLGLMLAGSTLFAQTPFFQSTTYAGAFAPVPTARWTDTWCNFDPVNTVYPTSTLQVTANITTNTTWTNNNVYWINDALIYVKPPAVLTIEPGTIIRGSGKGTLIIERGAKIIAQGTASQPIIFTTNKAVGGGRNYGDWGGVVICGSGRHNLVAGVNAIVEGGIGDAATQTGVHGGTNDNDSSGVFSYCRIEFCGISLTVASNSEINGLSMYSVGRKTKIDHVQVSYCGDDSYEWFGGAVDCRYLVAYRGTDDDFDTDNGYKGRVQFAASFRDPAIADAVSGSNGFESDNDAAGSANWPKTKAVFSNVTIVGPINSAAPGVINSNYRRSAHIRRNSGISIFNSLFLGFPTGVLVDGRRTVTNLCQDTSYYQDNVLAGMTTDFTLAASPVSDTLCMTNTAGVISYLMAGSEGNDTLNTTTAASLVDPFNLANPDARPNGGPIAGGSNFTNSFLSPLAVAPNSAFTVSDSTVCEGTTVTFTGTAQSFTSFQWVINGGTPSTSTAVAPTSTFNTPGTYVVTLTATNTLGTVSTSHTVVVSPNPSTPGITQTGTILQTSAATTYQWYFNGNPIGGATSQTYNATTFAGDYTVVITNAAGCSATSAIYSYTTGLAAFTLDDNSICEGESITYTATTVGADSYSWTFAGGSPSSSTNSTVTVTYNNPGSFATLLSVVQGLNSDNSNGIVTVNALPTPVITLAGSTLSTTVSYTTYQWLLNGNPVAGATSATYTFATNGAYSVEVTDANGCTNTSTVFNTNVGVESFSVENLNVYPNPAEGFTTVSFDATSGGTLMINVVDLNGRVVRNINNLEYNTGKNVYSIDVQGLSTGVYVLNVQTGNTYNTHKLIIK
jgi:PKD repeat protein